MNWLPETGSRKVARRRRWPWVILVALALLAAWFLAGTFSQTTGSPPQEELSSGFADISVSTKDKPYPPQDVNHFAPPPRVIYVYVVLKGFSGKKDLEARVERTGSGSILSKLLPGSGELQVRSARDEKFARNAGGISGVAKFALKTKTGEPIPAGNYQVTVYATGGGGRSAKKSFVVGD